MFSFRGIIAFALLALLAGSAGAQTVGLDAHTEAWMERLDAAIAQIEKSRAEVEELRMKVVDMRRENYPRGEARIVLLGEYEKAKKELARKEAEWSQLLEQARSEGLPAGIWQDYEEADPL